MKTKKLLAMLLVIAMAAMLCVCAFAEDVQPGATTTPTANQKDPEALIGKYLKVAEGVTVPDATFTFTFAPKASDTNSGGPQKQVFVAAQSMEDVREDTTNDKAWKKTIASVFTENGKLVFDAPGEYIYEVSETNDKVSKEDTENGVTIKETYTNDSNKYTVRIYVKYDDNGDLVIDTITIANSQGAKLDPTEDPTDDEGDDAFDPANPKGATFVNNYEKKITVDPSILTPENALLKVSKTVVDTNNYVKDDQAFPFTITVSKPANSTDAATPTVNAYIYDETINEETNQPIGIDTANPVTITYGQASDFSLKHNQYLLFGELPYGATYSVTEKLNDNSVVNHANFTASATWTDGTVATVDKGVNLTVGTGTVKDSDTTKDAVAYKNTFNNEDVTPTGILMNNLPYIILLVVVLGGLAGYVVSKRRREQE